MTTLDVRRRVGLMRYPIILALTLITATVSAMAQNPTEPRRTFAGLPSYPAIARAARIQGDVDVQFVLNANGETELVTAVSGPSVLRGEAEGNVKTWKFQLPLGATRTEWKYTTTFKFKISEDDSPYQTPKLTVVVDSDSYRFVEVVTNSLSSKVAHDCPTPDQTQPPSSIGDGDSVELSRSACFGTCPVYAVRVSANGDVHWRGHAFVDFVGEKQGNIGSKAARSLLQQFLSPSFWALCGGYDASVTDNPTMQIAVRFGDRSKTVWNYASSAPDFEEALEDAVDAAADTHLWRHGDPRTEPLTNILTDAYMPKPGVTPLMKAAARVDLERIKSALKSGESVDAVDSSGWTALMFAAAGSHSEPVPLLIAAGANPNHKSLAGDTPLMASAISRALDDDLLRAGADINAQNSHGTTALMILASDAESDEVADALKAGASASVKDAAGRTALDYLRLANCGRSPIWDWHMFETGGECNHLDSEDVQKVAALLKAAARKHSR
jgi:TonB family protein